MSSSGVSERLKLPGFGLPVNSTTNSWYNGSHHSGNVTVLRYPNAISDWAGDLLTVRERSMMAMMNQITDKPEWRRKVFDEEIISKWRNEVVTEYEAEEDQEDQGFTEAMFEYCITELQDKAKMHEDTGMVAVLDADVAVVKSDTIIPEDLKGELKAAVEPLEKVPDRLKDWHPGSDEKVLDLVHPSLFPLLYGRSRVLPIGRVGLKDCVESCGKGEVVPVPKDEDVKIKHINSSINPRNVGTVKFWSKRFQWLPCDVEFAEDDKVKIVSYINNLHPVHHEKLYVVIEKFIAKSIPLWSEVLNSILITTKPRIAMEGTEYYIPPREEEDENNADEDENEDEEEEDWERTNRILIKPDADQPYSPRPVHVNVNLREKFAKSGLQVIVKLATIHLTPNKPTYTSGTWHIEGQLNEHICATALYYYSSTNITTSQLSFRQKTTVEDIDDKAAGQDDHEGAEYLYGIEDGGPGIQELGSVATREGRLLAFANVLQHRVQPFRLADPTRPGHRKILALFLVDPFQRVVGTANVPPQQKEWWGEAIRERSALGELPPELMQFVVDGVDGDFPISLEEAKKVREELMDERRAFVEDVNSEYAYQEFSFCEH
ncbi:hypothetical protein AOQ84DRAFT_182162 [Glonium stellatum]|uniref:Uncharacterized protein n=1 Tax=Glonium stellatum TaxID=574774 RepID=A0A8E2EPW5_9PEZI|nr:hypothetical protein AOQ84DRAFT_182162 [Glonium stellatum]